MKTFLLPTSQDVLRSLLAQCLVLKIRQRSSHKPVSVAQSKRPQQVLMRVNRPLDLEQEHLRQKVGSRKS
ncbi:hypothetical protein MRX96_055775 [Rhipicephalus microplus]